MSTRGQDGRGDPLRFVEVGRAARPVALGRPLLARDAVIQRYKIELEQATLALLAVCTPNKMALVRSEVHRRARELYGNDMLKAVRSMRKDVLNGWEAEH